MLRYSEVFGPPHLKNKKSVRCRVLGATYDEKLLILVNTTSQTSIEEVTKEGQSTTVISFHKYIDVVSAHLSNDHELCHITERVPSPKGFSFVSRIYHIFGNAESKEITCNQPIDGFFLPFCTSKGVYQMIHVIGNRLTHLKITIQKNSVDYEKLRGGIHIPNIIYYHFDFKKLLLTAVYSNEKTVMLSTFKTNPQSIETDPPIQINVMQKAQLPYELALNPLAHLHLPYFHNANNRFYICSHGKKNCVIQQLFNGSDTSLSFCVSTYPQTFNQFITAPKVPSDIPLCFARFESIVIVFVPNDFICVIDIALSPLSITVLPKILASSLCSVCSSNLPMNNTIVDLDNSSIYNIELDFSKLVPFAAVIDQSAWYAFSLIIFRICSSEFLAEMIKLVVINNEIDCVQTFFKNLLANYSIPSRAVRAPTRSKSMTVHLMNDQVSFKRTSSRPKMSSNVKEIVDEFELEFPSSGKISRRKTFKIVIKILQEKDKWREFDHVVNKALVFLRRQNEGAIMIREAIDIWVKDYKPNDFWKLTICFIIQNEITFDSFPVIPCLREELSILGDALCSKPMKKKFEAVGIMPPSEQPDENAFYWKERMNLNRSSSSDDTATTSSRIFYKREESEHLSQQYGRRMLDVSKL
jgi:hypothetical protein